MENKNHKSSTYLALSAFSILFGMSIAYTFLTIVMPLMGIFVGKENLLFSELTVRLIPHPSDIFSLPQKGYFFDNIRASLLITSGSNGIIFLTKIVSIIYATAFTYGVYLVRRIMKNIYGGNHFLKENRRGVRIIAYMVILIPHICVFLENTIVSMLSRGLEVNGMTIAKVFYGPVNIFSFSLIPGSIYVGLILFLFTEVFKEGNKIKQENDLTV